MYRSHTAVLIPAIDFWRTMLGGPRVRFKAALAWDRFGCFADPTVGVRLVICSQGVVFF